MTMVMELFSFLALLFTFFSVALLLFMICFKLANKISEYMEECNFGVEAIVIVPFLIVFSGLSMLFGGLYLVFWLFFG